MKLMFKGAALALAVATMGMAAAPAQAQYYRGGWGDGWRGGDHRWDGRRWDNRRWEGRRWDRRNHWNQRRTYRGYQRGWRQTCWNEWRRGYYGERVLVRFCR